MHATRLIAIRHGETAWNVDTRIQGHLDIPLNDVGRWQARRAAEALAGEPIASIYASDLSRAFETAGAVAEVAGLAVVAEQGLRERNFGVFQGRTFAEIEAESPEQALRWRKRDPDFASEGGESLNRFRDRVVNTVGQLAARHPDELIVQAGHDRPRQVGGADDLDAVDAERGNDLLPHVTVDEDHAVRG